ncbi:MAG: cell division protein FtsA [Rickettsiales bacterium]|jgi:cell division protein FtsA|nr:cell division protein FtsA [Rickettsiales bacterium]
MADGGVIGFLDIGAGKVACVVAQADGSGPMRAAGVGECASGGIEDGKIADFGRLMFSINKATGDAEGAAGRRIASVVLSSTLAPFESRFLTSEISFGRAKDIGAEDIEKCSHRLAARDAVDLDRDEIVHVIPVRYVLDDAREEGDPIGIAASKLKILYHVVSADRRSLDDVLSAVRNCNLDVADVVAPAYAAGLGCLRRDEMRAGCMALDIGKSKISAGVFLRGNFICGFSLPLGGDYITNRIAASAGVGTAEAERAKLAYGAAAPESSDFSEYVEISGARGEESVLKADMLGVARPVVRLGFEVAAKYAEDNDLARYVKSVVLCGGGANMKGAASVANEAFGLPVRVGGSYELGGLGEKDARTEYAAAAGLVKYRMSKSPSVWQRPAPPAPSGAYAMVKKFLARFF